MTLAEWQAYPPTLRVQHLADIYSKSVHTVRDLLTSGSAKLPIPCERRPWGVNRDDCRRHYETRTLARRWMVIPAIDGKGRRTS